MEVQFFVLVRGLVREESSCTSKVVDPPLSKYHKGITKLAPVENKLLVFCFSPSQNLVPVGGGPGVIGDLVPVGTTNRD